MSRFLYQQAGDQLNRLVGLSNYLCWEFWTSCQTYKNKFECFEVALVVKNIEIKTKQKHAHPLISQQVYTSL